MDRWSRQTNIIFNVGSAIRISIQYAFQSFRIWLGYSKMANWDKCTIRQLHNTILDKNRTIALQSRAIREQNETIERLLQELNRTHDNYGYC